MATNQLIKVSRKGTAKPVSTDRLSEIEKTLDKLWNMFQTQVERNMELMSVIQKQQENSHKITFSLNQTEPAPVQKQLPGPASNNIPELGYEKLKRLETVLGKIVDTRIDAMHSMINVFHYLYQFGGEAYPEQLISLAGISSASFYRYLTRMREKRIIIMKRGKAVMTEMGRKIYSEELKPGIELDKAMYREKYHQEPPVNFFEDHEKRVQDIIAKAQSQGA